MSYWLLNWTQDEIDYMTAPYREFIGEDVYEDGKRNFFRMIADDYIAMFEAQADQYAMLKTIAPYIQNYLLMTVTGHETESLNCDEKAIDAEDAFLNIIVAPVSEEITELKTPTGDSDYVKQHNQSVSAEKYWKKYAGKVVEAIWRGVYGRIDATAHGFEDNEIVVVSFNPIYSPIGDVVIEDGAKYKIGYLDANSFFLRTLAGVAINMPMGSTYQLLIKRENTVPVLHLVLAAQYMSLDIVTVSCDLIGLYDSTGEFYIITANPVFSSDFLELTSTKLCLFADSQKMYEYPTPHDYNCVHWQIKDKHTGEEFISKMAVSATSRRLTVPASYGLSLSYQGNLDGIIDGIKINRTPFSFGASMYPIEELQELFNYVPSGFYWFASKYYDHPIVTGIDTQTLVTRTAAEELALVQEINTYVNQNFTYKLDPSDSWEFMGSGRKSGDCEDFALTKIQMLLDSGVSITKLKIDGGYPSHSEGAITIGHAWLLYDNQYVLDTSSNDLLSVAYMLSMFPRRITQIQGTTWNREGIIVTIPIPLLWPAENTNIQMFDFDMHIKKLIA